MADIAIFRINYKSDFILTLQSDAGWLTPFCIKFWTGVPSQAYYVGWDGETYTHCAYNPSEPTKLVVQFDDHHLPIGNLKYQIAYHFTVADFPNDTEDEVLNQENITTEIDGEEYQVMLDFNGETAPEIQFALPAYANEAQRIANEQARIAAEEQRIANEQARISAEETRQANEQQRINAEAERVSDFASLKTESEAATAAANIAATLANEKAQLADDKAALAQAAATLANAKAQLAADKAALAQAAATLANEKAALAQQKAEYAQEQGDAAKTEAETAHALNEEVRDDEEARDQAEQIRQQQETARQQAESQRVTDFNAQMQQQQTAYADAEAARDTAFDEAETERDAKVDEKVADITNLQAQVGYFVCDTGASVAAKTIAATGYVLTTGGNIRIKMTNANTADAVTLNINNTGAKALFYNGAQASSTNSWEAGEVIEVYYDGTNYQAFNAQGGGGDASKIKYDNSASGLNADNVQAALDEIQTKVLESGPYIEGKYVNNSGTLSSDANWKASDFLPISAVAAGDTFIWGEISPQIWAYVAFYAEDGTFLLAYSSRAATGATRTFTIPDNSNAIGATKVRASFLISGTPVLKQNNTNVLPYRIKEISELKTQVEDIDRRTPSILLKEILASSIFNETSNRVYIKYDAVSTLDRFSAFPNNTDYEVAYLGYRGNKAVDSSGWTTGFANYTPSSETITHVIINCRRSNNGDITVEDAVANITYQAYINVDSQTYIKNLVSSSLPYKYVGEIIRMNKSFDIKDAINYPTTLSPTQGMAIFGQYCVQGTSSESDGKTKAQLLDLDNSTLLSNLLLSHDGYSAIHCNTMCFGAETASGGIMPALYASQWDGQKCCFVYDIKTTGATLLQVIDPSQLTKDGVRFGIGNVDWVVDTEHGWLFALSYKGANTSVGQIITKFALPALSDGSVISLTDADIIDSAYLGNYIIRQDGCYYGNRLYLLFGSRGYAQYLAIHVIDVYSLCEVSTIPMTFLTNEPEGLDIYQGELMLHIINQNVIKKLVFN